MFEPFTAELTPEQKDSIIAAELVRVFIDGRLEAKLSRPATEPIKVEHYAPGTMRFFVENADKICLGFVDCRKDWAPEDIKATLAKFDTEDTEDHDFVVRLLVDYGRDFGEYTEMTRPRRHVT
jgi:hypothetical protein